MPNLFSLEGDWVLDVYTQFWDFPRFSSVLVLSRSATHAAVLSIRKSLRVLQKARIKIVARAIYTYLFFSYTYSLLFCGKIESCDHCFSQQIRRQSIQLYILQDHSSLRIGLNMNNKRCKLPVVYTMLV